MIMAQDEFEEVAGLGILSGDAIKMHDTAKVRPNPDRQGVDIVASCVYCGRENTITIEWAEMVIVSVGSLPPPGWKYDRDHGMYRPYLACPSCKREVQVGTTPDECKRHVMAGIAAQSFSQQQAAAIAADWQARVNAQQGQQGLARR